MTTRGIFGVLAAALLCACGTGSTGTPGPAGPEGPAGPMGSAATVRFRVLITSAQSSGGANHSAITACPAGSKIIAASCSCSPSPEVVVSASTILAPGSALGGQPGAHICTCSPPSGVTDFFAMSQATCVDGAGAMVE